MRTTRSEIKQWLEEGKVRGATHVIICVDTFDYEDYPVFVMPPQSAREKADEYRNKSMQRVMEVYNLSLDLNVQLSEPRAFHY